MFQSGIFGDPFPGNSGSGVRESSPVAGMGIEDFHFGKDDGKRGAKKAADPLQTSPAGPLLGC
jgi:hypothetical protein